MTKEKAEGLFRLRLNGVMAIFGMYGLKDFIPSAIEQITERAWQFHNDLNGKGEEHDKV